ncbi:hypothetical protein BZG02_19040 [Labilibaculum filiforme]|uniref:Uncharacterized protein n=1 Tax=Labilibaculum filiforme TaxID=1940526 RepID=A0A2N3HR94_9BACT|nr:hypothetical protein [Labilibaculum filiforme]PKQ60562.1 hypothetical protein BZG02_19040 [Labilibaculum filiforme]
MTKENFIEDLKQKESKDIFLDYLQGNNVWYFSDFLKMKNPSSAYDNFKRFVSQSLDVNFNNISIVGSGKVGFSMNPEKDFREFCVEHENPKKVSDIDLIIVSSKFFHKFWEAYLELFNEKVNFGYPFVSSSIFRKFVSIKNPKPIHPFFKEWIGKIDKFNKDYQTLFGIKHEINYRIYESWEAVELYHLKGIQELKEKFITT